MNPDVLIKKHKNILMPVLVAVAMLFGIKKMYDVNEVKHQFIVSQTEDYKEMENAALNINRYHKEINRIKGMFYPDSFSVISLVDKYANLAGVEVVSLNPVDAKLFGKNREDVSSIVVKVDIRGDINSLLDFIESMEANEDKILSVLSLNIKGWQNKAVQANLSLVGGVLQE